MAERTLGSRRVFDGRLLRIDSVEVELESGRRTVREVVRHPGAVAVLARLPDGRFVLVRQFRKAADRPLLEIVAGTLEPHEDPRDCAARELVEEAGCRAERLEELGRIFPAPGYTDERIHLYYSEVQEVAGGPAPDEDEDITVVRLSERDMEHRIGVGEIVDAKTLAAWLLYRRKSGDAGTGSPNRSGV
jgi:ADP-ribose pyrophosphatase